MNLAKIGKKHFAPGVIASIIKDADPTKLGQECAEMAFHAIRGQWSRKQSRLILGAMVAFMGVFCTSFVKKAVELMKR